MNQDQRTIVAPAVQVRANMAALEEDWPRIGAKAHDDDRPYVSAWDGERWSIVSYAFARMEDAERACAALRREGLDTAEKLMRAGSKKLLKIMAEAMAW